jgi:hypothetical protein
MTHFICFFSQYSHLILRLRLFVGLVLVYLVRALHLSFLLIYSCKWPTIYAYIFQYCTSSELSFPSIRGFIVIWSSSEMLALTAKALYLSFLLIYCLPNDPLRQCVYFPTLYVMSIHQSVGIFPNRCSFDHVFCDHTKRNSYIVSTTSLHGI